ncbi:SMI1/KNR4 family protein [Paenibacillus arenosi]|uniref:SMI1/KNR4 family protein n=1 Tax=Paenibacillus arenosi TaxID=2774142 RepID=A0ABR9ASW8_9BACL|nr:SMI1/KNR4 family protein [Paenibacillus arenosi]MBD8496976.1 SMI1/KNR4 family protein [Paenibacillus arenosi]
MFIKKTLQELYDVYKDGSRVVIREEGYNFESICVFHAPATSHDISRLVEKYPDMPKDYLEFLSVTNGLAPFTETDFFGGGDIYRIDSVIEINAAIKHPAAQGNKYWTWRVEDRKF